MPIHGLIPSLMEVGKIKIGMKGDETVSKNNVTFRKAKKIDHFRIVTNERDDEDNYISNIELLETIKKGKLAKYNKDGNITCIPIRLLYNDIDLVFPTEVVSMVNWKRSCSGDRKNAVTRDGRKVKCPCHRLEPDYNKKDKCKYSGVLSCIIEGSNIGGCHKFRTKGYNSVNYILSSLSLIKTMTGGLLAFLPLQLVVTSKQTVNPVSGESLTIQVVTVESRGTLGELQQLALNMGDERNSLIKNMSVIEAEAKKALLPETMEEEKEIFEEFYPDNIIEEKESEPKDEKNKAAKKDTSKEKVGSEPVEPQNKTKPDKEEDSLLGSATIPESVNKSTGLPTESTVPETTVMPGKDSEEKKPVKQETSTVPEKIRKDQLVKILDLKVNKRQINDQKVWHKLIKGMKFINVTKANDMTAEQGDKFIEYLETLDKIPF